MVQGSGRVTLWAIEAFVATAEEGAVSAAARRLGASPSAISQQLSALETALGAVLIDRTTRPATLTHAGEIFQRRARRILAEAQQARAEVAALDLADLTDFRLGMIEDFDADVTPRLLSDMAEELKLCQFSLETGPSHRMFDALDHGDLDVIVAADIGARADWMETHPLLHEPFVAALPPGRCAEGADLLPLLQTLPLIHYTQRHHMGRRIAAHLTAQNLFFDRRFELDSYHAIMAMVAGGAGWTILTPLGYLSAQRFRHQVDLHPLPFAPLTRQISLSARRGVLQDMPERMAGRLRPLLQEMVVTPAIRDMPWLAGELRVL